MRRWQTSLVWFRRDLRDFDHAALHHALTQSQQVYCVFVYDTDVLEPLRESELTFDRRVAFIHDVVGGLQQALRALGGELLIRHGRASDVIPALAAELDAEAVYANRDYEPQAVARDRKVAEKLKADGRHWQAFKDQVIFDTEDVLAFSGKPYSVFTPYKRAWLRKLHEGGLSALTPYPVAPYKASFARAMESLCLPCPSLEEMGFASVKLGAMHVPTGMAGGAKLLDEFSKRIQRYDQERDFPALDVTSHLSAHLRFGTVSIRSLVQRAVDMIRSGEGGSGAQTWLSELVWREFYSMILHHHPHAAKRAFKSAYDAIVWESGSKAARLFQAWCDAKTGYPLVDAAMAQINQTGFMHNRLRMVSASFLVKDLGVDWRWGERYFAHKLVDYELASNNGGWQWVASSGCDAQPYFRIFNPVTQSKKFDPEGVFIRRYLPQLAMLDNKTIHAPWTASAEALSNAGIRLGESYPVPIIEHEKARQLTLARYAVVKKAV